MNAISMRLDHADNERMLLGRHLARTASRRNTAARVAALEGWAVEPGSTLPAWTIALLAAAMMSAVMLLL